MNEYTKSEKKFSVMMATATITCDMISGFFNRCEKRSAPLFESMHLHLAEMPPEKKGKAVERDGTCTAKLQDRAHIVQRYSIMILS